MKRELKGSEAIYGFCGWLTTRNEVTVMSSSSAGGAPNLTDCAIIADLIDEFCKTNDLSEPNNGWEKILIHPK